MLIILLLLLLLNVLLAVFNSFLSFTFHTFLLMIFTAQLLFFHLHVIAGTLDKRGSLRKEEEVMWLCSASLGGFYTFWRFRYAYKRNKEDAKIAEN